MLGQQQPLIRTKLIPPRLPRQTLARDNLLSRLAQAYELPLTIVQAGAGYGKSTVLAAFVAQRAATVWYHLEAEDADPLRFLQHLLYGLGQVDLALVEVAQVQLEQWDWDDAERSWRLICDTLVNALTQLPQELLLVLDDAHLLLDKPAGPLPQFLARLLQHAPPTFHLLLATRYAIPLPNLLNLRMQGQLLEIGQDQLSFSEAEITRLLADHYGIRLAAAEARLLSEVTEGWPMVVQLVGRQLQGGGTVTEALNQLARSGGNLFQYLAQEVLAGQPAGVQTFLRETAVLSQLTAPLCDALRGAGDSREMLRYLVEQALFVTNIDENHVRYHHLFRELLLGQMAPEVRAASHRQAAAIFAASGQIERALEHYLAAGSDTEATPLLATYGQQLIQVGRLDTLNGWLSSLPPHNLLANPTLLVYMGDIARLRSRFDEALGWYQRAEELCRQTRDVPGLGKALRGQARVFLDTVNPSRAEALLQEALSLADGQLDRQTRARLLDLLAENLLNQGRLDDAERFQGEARALREEGPGQAELPYRMMLRTGRLNEARQQLAAQAHQEQTQPVQRPRAHRETLLLLSIILAFQGEREEAFAAAEEGTERGRQLNSPFVVAVGLMRQGHGWLLARDENGYRQAIECFQAAIGMSKTLEVARLRVEAYWGLTQAHGCQGQLEQAQLYADKGIALARQAGDEWISACIYTSLGASYLLTGRYEPALIWLNRAIASFQECSDTFGQTVARLWLGYLRFLTGDEIRLQHEMEIVLRLTHEHGYEFLFRQTSLLGPPDPRSLIPLLLQIRGLPGCAAAANQLLSQLGLADLEYHPGYQLRIKTLGAFQVWRGPELVSASEWRRQAARQFLQLLLSQPQALLHREQICEQLWPEATADEALNQFKVAYNSLCKVLEPDRARNAPSAFIARDGSRYGLRQTADVALDQMQFDQLISQADKLLKNDPAAARQSYERAIALYEGDFLVGFPYEPWAEQERLRLRNRFLRAAERLAEGYLGQGQWRAAQELADRMLQVDPCWEPAYRTLMGALANLGNHGELLRTYQRCRETLARELAVEPAPATEALYQALLRRGE